MGMGATEGSGRLDMEEDSIPHSAAAAGTLGRAGAARSSCRGEGMGWVILWDLLSPSQLWSKQWESRGLLGPMRVALRHSTPQ